MNLPNARTPQGRSGFCHACGAAMLPFFEARDYNRRVSQRVFHYARCAQCGLISLVDVPDDLPRYYPPGYHLLPLSQDTAERSLESERYKIDIVRRFVKSGHVVEIGPSWGAFCLLAKRAGFSVEAIEMNHDCCEFLRTKLGIRAVHSADEGAALEETSPADVIAMWHVIEHLRDPWAVLSQATKRLRPGGIIVAATPNAEALQLRVFRGRWTHVDAPRHLHLFPPRLLASKLEALGLERMSLTTTDPGSLGWNRFGWRFSLANLAPVAALRRPLQVAGDFPALLFSPLERREGIGSAYTAVYRKPLGR